MNRWNKSFIPWQGLVGYFVMIAALLACQTVTSSTATPVSTHPSLTTPETQEIALRLENGAIEQREENGDWLPIAGETTFEITGALESTDPWMVNGNTFATRDSTHIEEGLEVGNLVRVEGVILEDGTWLAYSIERTNAEGQPNPTIILIGKVTSMDPWVVNGITLNVTSDTLIGEAIEPDMIVRVEILLLDDGTWEVLSIVPLGNFTDVPGCATIVGTVFSVNGNEIQLVGWPVVTFEDDVKIEDEQGSEVALSGNDAVLVVVCSSEDGQIRITHIIVLNIAEEEIPSDGGGEKVLVCHKPDKKGGHTLSIPSSAVAAHLGHGDKLGPCP